MGQTETKLQIEYLPNGTGQVADSRLDRSNRPPQPGFKDYNIARKISFHFLLHQAFGLLVRYNPRRL